MPVGGEKWLSQLAPLGKPMDDRALGSCEGDPSPRTVDGRGEGLGITPQIDPRHLPVLLIEHHSFTDPGRDEPLPAPQIDG